MAERFHHPQVDRLRDATQSNPSTAARRLGRTWQRQLHRQVMRAIRQERASDPEWGPGAQPADDQER